MTHCLLTLHWPDTVTEPTHWQGVRQVLSGRGRGEGWVSVSAGPINRKCFEQDPMANHGILSFINIFLIPDVALGQQ